MQESARAAVPLLSMLNAQGARNVKPAKLFMNYMVLQRGTKVPIWGTADPDGAVGVEFNGQTRTATVGNDGRWMVTLDPMEAGGPYVLKIAGANAIEITDVMVGDVWLCGGQSNMAFGISRDKIEENVNIRFCDVPGMAAGEPQENLREGHNYWWLPMSLGTIELGSAVQTTLKGVSAVPYYFARELYHEFKVPIGLIDVSRGGTFAEGWVPLATMKASDDFRWLAERYEHDRTDQLAETQEQFDQDKKAIYAIREQFGPNRQPIDIDWTSLGFNDAQWKQTYQPGGWGETVQEVTALVDFRKQITIPKDWAGKDLTLSLGTIDEYDRVFFNGVDIGSIGHGSGHDYWAIRRTYRVPGELVKAGEVCVAVRIANVWRTGGFTDAPERMFLGLQADKTKKVSLAGDWKYHLRQPIVWTGFHLGPGNPLSPSVLYNAMVHPVAPFAIKGVIWYQGEGNAWRAWEYRKLLPLLIQAWRDRIGQGNIPFLIVQLPNYQNPAVEPSESAWAELREAQTLVADTMPNCGLTVTIDLGEAWNSHPTNKLDVGKRLALTARKVAYGQNIVHSGPVYRTMEKLGDRIRIRFEHVGSGLIAKGGPLTQFAIAGEDREYHWADATIEGDAVIVWSDQVKDPVSVRYAWAGNPQGCNLYNREGLPAMPFRTDDYEGITRVKR